MEYIAVEEVHMHELGVCLWLFLFLVVNAFYLTVFHSIASSIQPSFKENEVLDSSLLLFYFMYQQFFLFAGIYFLIMLDHVPLELLTLPILIWLWNFRVIEAGLPNLLHLFFYECVYFNLV